MKQMICVLLLLAIVSQSNAMDLAKKRDIWDLHHISASCIGTAYFNHVLEMPFWKAALTSMLIGLAWEGLDELYYRGKLGHRTDQMDTIFDWRIGFDSKDVLRNGIGIGMAFPIRKQPQRVVEVRVPSTPYEKK